MWAVRFQPGASAHSLYLTPIAGRGTHPTKERLICWAREIDVSSHNRRDFILYQLAAASASSGLKAAGKNDEIRMGHIGVGIQGMNLLRGFHAIPGVRNVVACDLYDGHLACARETAEGIESTKEYRKVLERKDIDAVAIATPDHWHHQMVLEALSAGKHLFVEKPLAWNIEQGQDIVAAVAKTKLLLQVGSQAKTSALTAKAREIIASGALGRINMVRMDDARNAPEGAWVYPIPPDASPETIDWEKFHGPAPEKAFDPKIFFRWRCWWEYSGGVATDLFVHLITDMHEALNLVAPVSAVSQGGLFRWKDGRTVPDVMNSILQYPDGTLMDVYVDLANAHSKREILIMGSEGTLVKDSKRLVLYPEAKHKRVQRYGTSAWPKECRRAISKRRGTARRRAAAATAAEARAGEGGDGGTGSGASRVLHSLAARVFFTRNLAVSVLCCLATKSRMPSLDCAYPSRPPGAVAVEINSGLISSTVAYPPRCFRARGNSPSSIRSVAAAHLFDAVWPLMVAVSKAAV